LEILSFPVTPFATNAFVLRDGKEALVIDPGEATSDLKASVEGYTVPMVVNTHCHIDHSGGNAEMVKLTGAPLACHEADVPLLENLSQQAMMFGVSCDPSPPPDKFLDEGDEIAVGDIKLTVRHTPGHAPGHIVLVGDGFVFAGDVLFTGSIGRTDLPGGSYDELMNSIATKLLTLPDETVVYNGHSPPTTIGAERASNPFLQELR